MSSRRLFISIISIIAALSQAHAQHFVDYGPAKRFIDLEAHAIVAGSMITENYLSCFPEISQMNTSPGTAIGAGVSAVFGLRDWIGLGTEIDFIHNRYRVDMAVTSEDVSSVSNIFLRNSANYINIPIYIQFRFNVSPKVRWCVDGGIYYAYGLSGSQRQDIYNAQVNSLGQLVSSVDSHKYDYFGDPSTFIHSYRRSDLGLHIATSLQFRKFSIGGRLNVGFKNIAYIPGNRGIVIPNVHNLSYSLVIGYRL